MKSILATESVDFGEIKSNPRQEKISKITIHHMASNMEARDCALMHRDSTVQSSANYYIGTDGTICSGISEDRRAWTSASRWNDHRAITIEVANNTFAPSWTVSAKAYDSLIKLCADICKRYDIKPYYDGTASASLTIHSMFISTECCGPYLKGLHENGQIEKDIKKAMNSDIKPAETTELYRVQCGAFKIKDNAKRLEKQLIDDGFQTYLAVTNEGLIRVQCGAFRVKENAENLRQTLINNGYTDAFITSAANQTALDRDGRTAKRTAKEIAEEIIRGEGNWGNDPERTVRLKAAGYDADAVQKAINELMK